MPLPHLECLFLTNMLVEEDDFASPFSAPKLRHICLRNCGKGSLDAARNFINNPDQLYAAVDELSAVACLCECNLSDNKCQHKRFKYPESVLSHLKPAVCSLYASGYGLVFDDPDANF